MLRCLQHCFCAALFSDLLCLIFCAAAGASTTSQGSRHHCCCQSCYYQFLLFHVLPSCDLAASGLPEPLLFKNSFYMKLFFETTLSFLIIPVLVLHFCSLPFFRFCLFSFLLLYTECFRTSALDSSYHNALGKVLLYEGIYQKDGHCSHNGSCHLYCLFRRNTQVAVVDGLTV